MATFLAAHIFGGRSTHTPTSNPTVPRYLDEIGLTNSDIGDGSIYHFEMTEEQLWRVLHDADRAQFQTRISGTVFCPEGDGRGYSSACPVPTDFVLDVAAGYLPEFPPVRGFREDLIALSGSGSPTGASRGSLLLGTMDFAKVAGSDPPTYDSGIGFFANVSSALRFLPGGWMKLPRGPRGSQTYLCEFELNIGVSMAPQAGYEYATGFSPPASPAGSSTVYAPGFFPASGGTVNFHAPFPPGSYGETPPGLIGSATIVELLAGDDPSIEGYARVRIEEVDLFSTGSFPIRSLP